MTYKEISKLIDDIHKEDIYIVLKINIVAAVDDNLDTSDYRDVDYERACRCIFEFVNEIYRKTGELIDVDDLVFRVEELIEDGDFEEPTWECVEQAYEGMAG